MGRPVLKATSRGLPAPSLRNANRPEVASAPGMATCALVGRGSQGTAYARNPSRPDTIHLVGVSVAKH